MGTAFTYQGKLADGANPASGNYDLKFTLFDTNSGGNAVTGPLTNAVAVSNGLFTTTLNFGGGVFAGTERWLEIAVRTNGGGAFTTLSSRQPVSPTPYAIYSAGATSATTATLASSVPWSGVTGLPAGFADNSDNDTTYSAGTGLGLAGSTFSLDTAFTDGRYWRLAGNSGTTPGVNFLGTTDNQALELKVNNSRALRLEPTTNAPNVIGGYSGNSVSAGVYGAVIGGGGTASHPNLGGPWPNTVTDTFGTIAGGLGNRIEGATSFIGGGFSNLVQSAANYAVIAGGFSNAIGPTALGAVIGGGQQNLVQTHAQASVIAGGAFNTIGVTSVCSAIGGGIVNSISNNSSAATIAGGGANRIGEATFDCTIGGGNNNVIERNVSLGFIGGGGRNRIETNSDYSTIAGGYWNDIGTSSASSAIGGGTNNVIGPDTERATIGGGSRNTVESSADIATIAGGSGNSVRSNSLAGTIGGGWNNAIFAESESTVIAGGYNNSIREHVQYASIGGGAGNVIRSNAYAAVISGGNLNVISNQANNATISGGGQNVVWADSEYATIGGGLANLIETNSTYSTIGGGYNHTIQPNASYGTVGGGYAHTIATNADYATIPGGRHAQAAHYGQFAYASGRFATVGDAQTSVYVLRRTTSSATQAEMFLDGASLRMTVPDGASWTFEALVVARSSTGDSAGYRLIGVVENVGGAMAGSYQATQVLREDVAAWDVSASTDNVNDALIIQVTGAAATTIRWVASVRTVEVTY